MHTAKSKKSGYRRRSVGFQLYGIQEKAKLWTQGKDLWLPGLRVGGEGDEQADAGNFPGSETALYDSIMLDTRHDAFVQSHGMCKSELLHKP